MKALFVNGGPRKNGNTMDMLNSAIKGAVAAGAETELIHLFDYEFHGCRSCFACKLKGAKTNGVCAIKDELRPILEKAIEADVIVIGSPVFLSNPTGETKAFLDRLVFAALSYNPKIEPESGEMEGGILEKTIPTAMIYSLGNTKENTDELNYPIILGEYSRFLEMVFGYSETMCAYSAMQFKDYSKYDVMEGTEEFRRKHREEQYPKELEAAYELGQRLVEKAQALR